MILPYDNIDFESILNDLCQNNSGRKIPFINRYEVESDKYIQVNNFKEHQRPHHTEKDSVLPPKSPIDNGAQTVTPRRKKLGKEAGQGKEEGTVIGKGIRKRREYPAMFERLWILHPKGGKEAAYKAFRKLSPAEKEVDRWVARLEAYRESQKWIEGISPNLSTWINQGYFDGEASKPPVDEKKAEQETLEHRRQQAEEDAQAEANLKDPEWLKARDEALGAGRKLATKMGND